MKVKKKVLLVNLNLHLMNILLITILTKSYDLRTGPDEEEPLAYEGPEIVKSKGCDIQWNKGKNVTMKMVKKRQKHKNRGTIRVVTKEVQTDSFFNFFSPPTGKFFFLIYAVLKIPFFV